MAAARATGADVPVCLDPRPRVMRGIGDVLSAPLDLPRLPAVLVNPGVAVPTKDVFAALKLSDANSGLAAPSPLAGEGWGGGWRDKAQLVSHRGTPTPNPSPQGGAGAHRACWQRTLCADRNDLEAPAITLQPVIADVLAELRAAAGCELARMSGSGATCFGLFASGRAAAAAASALREQASGVVGPRDGVRLTAASVRPVDAELDRLLQRFFHRRGWETARAHPWRWRRSGARAGSCPRARGAWSSGRSPVRDRRRSLRPLPACAARTRARPPSRGGTTAPPAA